MRAVQGRYQRITQRKAEIVLLKFDKSASKIFTMPKVSRKAIRLKLVTKILPRDVLKYMLALVINEDKNMRA